MKNKSLKIIITVWLMLIMLMISSTSLAMKTINGNTYYTDNDINQRNGHIEIYSGAYQGIYFCANHGRSLDANLITDETSDRITKSTNGWVRETGITDKTNLSQRKELSVAQKVSVLKKAINSYLQEKNKTATISGGVTTVARDSLEATISAFANTKEFNFTDQDIQDAVWNYGSLINESKPSEESNPVLWNAANAYVDWANPTGENGTYYTQNQPNLIANTSDAKVNVNYENASYLVGPITVSYDAGYKNGDVQFTKNFTVSFIDQNGKELNSAKIMDMEGNVLNEAPNGDSFFVEFPYAGNENVKSIKLLASVDYISSVYGEVTSYKTQTQTWTYAEFEEPSVSTKTTYSHSTAYTTSKDDETGEEIIKWKCGKHGVQEERSYWTKNDISCITGWYMKVSLSATLKQISQSESDMQDLKTLYGYLTWDTVEAEAEVKFADDIMEIAGYVWEDKAEGKDSTYNGLKDENDTLLSGIEVRLYQENGELAEVYGTNPVLTDANGHYSFTGINPTKKYYVVFTYDGMIYTNTYGAGKPEYNTSAWNASSKGSELVNERGLFNEQFITIGSYPKGYKVPVAIFTGNYLTEGYNEVFHINDEKVSYYKTKITEKLNQYLSTQNRLKDEDYIKCIYEPILNEITDNNEKILAKKILQFIWDCRINSYAGNESIQDGQETINGLYPYKNKFVLTNNMGERIVADKETYFEYVNGKYYVIYNGQLYVNQGLIRRNETDLELSEDLYETVVSINGKDETYKYGALSKTEIGLVSSDLMSYTQNIAYSDYDYSKTTASLSSGLDDKGTVQYPDGYAPIQVYITYKIRVKNNSNILTSVDEVVSYIDAQYYSYSDNYTTTQGKEIKGVRTSLISNNIETELNNTAETNTSSKYGKGSETGNDLGTGLYISFDEDIILENQQSLAIYVTYRLGENSTTNDINCTYNQGQGNEAYRILQDVLKDDTSELKIKTITEINGFRTFYSLEADSENTRQKYNNYYKEINGAKYRAAGVLDSNSIPGNLTTGEIEIAHNNNGISVEERLSVEDDWDEASTIVFKKSGNRSLTGNVWETVNQNANYWANTSDYPYYNNSYKVKDITVELIELKNGQEYVRAIASTNENGEYKFEGYIPGEYTVRFIYGDRAKYDTIQHSPYTTFSINDTTIKCAYNGQYYQSTKANPNTNNNQFWYAVEENTRYSDAYDEANLRNKINTELQEYTYKDIVNVLNNPEEKMAYAYTSMLDIYPEKAKTETFDQNPGYTISNVDFGLTLRTTPDLQIKKEVSHIKLILQNGTVQIDADTETIREQGVPGVVQAAVGHDITISMSSEMVNGATLEITYMITVTNNGPKETITYYKDSTSNIIAIGLYNEDVSKLICYEDAIRVYENKQFEKQDESYVSYINAGTTKISTMDSSKTEVRETKTRAVTVVDFIPNNLNFIKNDYTGKVVNEGWDIVTSSKDNFVEEYYKQLVNNDTILNIANINSQEVYDSNTIVMTNGINSLVPNSGLGAGESVSEEIILSKVISVNNDSTDSKSYSNKVRILKIFDSNSRLQDMVSADSEKVIISDPTGIGSIYLIIILTLIVALIIGTGVFFIKKFVVQKNKK